MEKKLIITSSRRGYQLRNGFVLEISTIECDETETKVRLLRRFCSPHYVELLHVSGELLPDVILDAMLDTMDIESICANFDRCCCTERMDE